MGTLTARTIHSAAPGRHTDGEGLQLLVKSDGRKTWLVRIMHDGVRRDYGLGSWPIVGLAEAREKARVLRAGVVKGVDPVREKRIARAALAEANARTFEAVARIVHAKQSFQSEKLSRRWIGRLERFAFPAFGDMPVDRVSGPEVIAALESIWLQKPETARRVRQLVARVLSYAHVRGWRGPSPMLAEFTKALPAQRRSVHHAAVDYRDAPGIYHAISLGEATPGRLALRLTILTATRSGEVRGARRNEFDLQAGLWMLPSDRMKMRRDHVVPLSHEALAIVRAAFGSDSRDADPRGIVFEGRGLARGAGIQPLSDTALSAHHKRISPTTTVHGWRSTFRDWAGETTSFPADVCEMALAHQVGNATTRAYQRGQLLEKRRELMNAWAEYLTAPAALP